MNIDSGFVPKQARPLLSGAAKVSTYEETGGEITTSFASHNLSLIPPIPGSSIIHDNASGAGNVTRLILANAPENVKIHATDKDQDFLDVLQHDVLKNNWPVEVANMKSEELAFPNDYFTHSITNIAIFFTANAGLSGAREIYRTLKPGGVAIANCWEKITWLPPIAAVHSQLRPGKPFPAPPINWSDGVQIQKVLREAGFEEGKMRVEKSEVWAKTKDLRRWAELTWAFLGGIGGWQESDEERWNEGIDMLVELLEKAEGTKFVGEEVWMRATQWVVVAKK